VLVVTYQAIEAAFAGIPGVLTAHFNAIAGIDRYRDVRALIVIGRPLPPPGEVEALAGAVFGTAAAGGYTSKLAGLHLRTGPPRGVRVLAHPDPAAETLRAAICDDELIQAIGRGRGVNRTEGNPLDVFVLADVALPLVHDRLTTWEAECPGILQRMLLEGVAVDSPADAVALHPSLFSGEKQAQKVFEREGFKRQNPLRDPTGEMSLKSAAYRRPGRGRPWQRCWWLDGSADEAKARLEAVLGQLTGWEPG